MERWKQTLYLNNIRETIERYHLIEPGDRVLVGLSGGKDSGLLFKALYDLSQYKIYDFEVSAFTLNHGMMDSLEALTEWCQRQGMHHIIYNEPFVDRLIQSELDGFSACYTCARMRKGILKKVALEKGYNKIAFGHTRDDLVETLMMNIMKQGRMAAIPPKTLDEMSGLAIIRPLILLEETKIIIANQKLGTPIVRSTCKFAPDKARAKADGLVIQLEELLPNFSEQMAKALQNIDVSRLL